MLLWCFVLGALLGSACGDLVCPATPTVTAAPNGSLAFSSLPPITAGNNIEVSYSGGGLSGWYAISRGFAETVKGNDVPYADIYTTVQNGGGGSPTVILGSLVKLFEAIIAVTVLGLLLAVAFLVIGGIFWCCRCCGNCGGERRQDDKDHMGLLTMVATSVLVLFTCIVLGGAVLAFFSNQLFYDSYTEFPMTAKNSLEVAKQYASQTGNQLDALFCQLDDTGKAALQAIDNLVNTLNNTINGAVGPILSRVVQIGQSITTVNNALLNINSSAAILKSMSQTLSASVSMLNSNVTTLRAQLGCNDTMPPSICSMVPAANFTTVANFSNLPDISGQVKNVSTALQNVILQQSIVNVTTSIQTSIRGNASAIQDDIKSIIKSVLKFQANTSAIINDLVNKSSSAQGCGDTSSINGIENCVAYLTDFITPYNKAVYGVGLAICSFALVTVVLVGVGVVLGVAGFQRYIRPHERSSLSNCGGIFLLIAVGVTYLFGFFLLVLMAVAFLLSSFLLIACDGLQGPQYPLIEQLQPLINLPINVNLSKLLNQCQNDAGIYIALNLSSQVDLARELNIENQIPNLYGTFNSTTNSINFNNQSVLFSNARDALNSFANAGITTINYNAFQQQVNASIVSFNTSAQISQLLSLRSAVMNSSTLPNMMQIVSTINGTIAGLTDLSNNQLPAMQQQVDVLGSSVSTAQALAGSAVQNASSLLSDTAVTLENFATYNSGAIIMSLNSTYTTVVGYVTQLQNHVISSLQNNVAGCLPVSKVYDGIYSNLCQKFLGGLIEFWWSLGLCVLFFPAVIISAVITSRFFLRMKFDDPNDIEYMMKPTMKQ